jgi:hypothetical protein
VAAGEVVVDELQSNLSSPVLTAMKTSMRIHFTSTVAKILDSVRHRGLILMIALGGSVPSEAGEVGKSFLTPEDAVSAVVAAASAQDADALRAIFGPAAAEIETPIAYRRPTNSVPLAPHSPRRIGSCANRIPAVCSKSAGAHGPFPFPS